MLSECNGCKEIVANFGGSGNEKTALRIAGSNVNNSPLTTPGILSSTNFKHYWVHALFKEDGTLKVSIGNGNDSNIGLLLSGEQQVIAKEIMELDFISTLLLFYTFFKVESSYEIKYVGFGTGSTGTIQWRLPQGILKSIISHQN